MNFGSPVTHLDADAFFASVEQAADPRLRGRPIAVGGEKRGIIAAASYEARRYGIFTPMPTAQARKLCPELILLPGDFEKYERFSRWMFSYAYDFTPDIEITSIDEGYFDFRCSRRPVMEVAQTIRKIIQQSLKISVSTGIGPNKLVSQIASKLNKPAAFLRISEENVGSFLEPLPSRWLPGIGPGTADRLSVAGLTRIGQIAQTPLDLLHLLLGGTASKIRELANGIDYRPVIATPTAAKSYGRQETFGEDQTDEEWIAATLRRMADGLFAKVRREGRAVRTLTVKVRYNDMVEDRCSESLVEPTDLETDVYGRLNLMLKRAWKRRVSLRLVSLRLSNVYNGFFREELRLDNQAEQHEARRRLAVVIDELRRRRGPYIILRGHDFLLRETKAKEGLRDRFRPSSPAGSNRLHQRTPVPREGCKRLTEMTGGRVARSRNRSGLTKGGGLGIPLQVRSYYSFLNSTLSIDSLMALAKQHRFPAVTLCDQGNLHGAVEFFQAAGKAGIQPVLGAEIRVEGTPVQLYVENQKGYYNLCRILSLETNEGKAGSLSRVALGEQLEQWGTDVGLVAVSPSDDVACFFSGRFYLGIASREQLRQTRGSKWPRVWSRPIHYADPSDHWKFNVVQSIRTLTLLNQGHPDKLPAAGWHCPEPEGLKSCFSDEPDVLARSCEIMERCSGFRLPMGPPQFPRWDPPTGESPRDFLRQLVLNGLNRRYGEKGTRTREGRQVKFETIRRQVKAEMQIIHEVGYEEYFLGIWDILRECKRAGIDWITRGSAADSLVCYCLGISSVCPIRFGLFFRRFLNRERMIMHKLPDIDVDFAHDRKDEVVDLIFDKARSGCCAAVGGFSTYKARGAIGDIGKVLGLSEYQVRRFTERLPWSDARGTIEATIRSNRECCDLPIEEEPYSTAVQMADFLEGFPRYPKMHPCGIVLSRQPMHELTPTFRSHKGYPTTHFDMDSVEAIGLVKMDILAQGGLATMRDVVDRFGRQGMRLNLEKCSAEILKRRAGVLGG